MSILLTDVLDGRAKPRHMEIIEETARSIAGTAACAIGRHAAKLVLDGVQGFADDYWEHISNHRCLGNLENPVPCVALCPAGVDIPGYIAGDALPAGLGVAEVQKVQRQVHRTEARRRRGDAALHVVVELVHHHLGPVRGLDV